MGWVYPQYKELIDPSAHMFKTRRESRWSLEGGLCFVLLLHTSAWKATYQAWIIPPPVPVPFKKKRAWGEYSPKWRLFWVLIFMFYLFYQFWIEQIADLKPTKKLWRKTLRLAEKPIGMILHRVDVILWSWNDQRVKWGRGRSVFFCGFA